MKKEIKKFLAMILAVMLVIGVVPFGGEAKVNAATAVSTIELNYDGVWPAYTGDAPVLSSNLFSVSGDETTTYSTISLYYSGYYDSSNKWNAYSEGDTLKAGKNKISFNICFNDGYTFSTNMTIKIKDSDNKEYTFNAVYSRTQVKLNMFNIDYEVGDKLVSDAVTLNYSGGKFSIKEDELVPLTGTYSISDGTVYTFSSLSYRQNGAAYNSTTDKFKSGELEMRLVLDTASDFNFPSTLSVTFNGKTDTWNSTATYTYNKKKQEYICKVNVPAKDAKNLSEATVQITDYEDWEDEESGYFYYTGSAIEPTVEVTYSGTKLVKDTDYTVSYSNNVNANNTAPKVTVTGKGNYSGTNSVVFPILSESISKVTVTAISNQTYTGSAIKPALTVTYKGKTLVADTDYTAEYSNNVNEGTASVKLTGKGNFKGSKEGITFKIEKKSNPTPEPTKTPTKTPTKAPSKDPEPTSKLPEALQNATSVASGDSLTFEKTGTTGYKFELTADSFIQLTTPMGTYYDDALEMKIYDSEGKELQKFTQERRNSDSANSYTYDSKVMSAGTYYVTITGTDSKNQVNGTVKLTVNVNETNVSESGAETITLPVDGTPTVLKWNQAKSGGAWTKHYYTLVVPEKTYYTIVGSAFFGGIKLYPNSFNDSDSMLTSTEISRDTEILLDKGTYYLVAYGRKQGDTTLTINSRDFIDIKSITGTDYYEVYKGAKEKISLTIDPAENESSIKWTEPAAAQMSFIDNYDYDTKDHLPKNEAYIYAHSLGKYSSTITTSEGVSFTVNFMVKPAPVAVSKAEAVTKNKKKATLTLEWSGNGNYYKIWEKGPKDKDYKVVKEVASTEETTKVTLNKKPGQNFSYKIESCYKIAGEVVCSSTGEAVAAFTAPNKAPKIKSLKQSGGTKYTKPYTKRYWVDTTRTRLGHYEVYHLGNTSTATVKVSVGKLKGCKAYETAKNKHCPGTISKGKFVYTYSGKIKSTSEKVKIRGIWKQGKCTAYGPWSKTKSVKIKGNK